MISSKKCEFKADFDEISTGKIGLLVFFQQVIDRFSKKIPFLKGLVNTLVSTKK